MTPRKVSRAAASTLGACLALVLAFAGCGSGGAGQENLSSGSGTAPASTSALPGSLVVLGPGGLSGVLARLDEAFAAAHPGSTVSPNLGRSPAQELQLRQGFPADVFLTVGSDSMTRASRDGLVAGGATVFARNRLQIIVAAGNPRGVHTLADLAKPGLTVVLPDESTPVGGCAARSLAKAGVTVRPASREPGGAEVAEKVATGNADAGLVFGTDVRAAGTRVTGVDVADADQVPAEYVAAVLRRAQQTDTARAFVSFLTTPVAQQHLRQFGFLAP
ncbi:molybdate ABC transporter substrate-binding protein [Frankia sp. R82]|uniref:molybdate ABC transporter substrate-binding protein n=1 Tax=Frankia sp. R82 TaxID=2950553 RepID=UPI0020435DF2|nr:molybdate ABC transporter substrate-binding protein [Frankia sp. R82]MCM3882889.1 molybdate ABC transporter substrate-binding protein [Frankia sp. R82]